MSGCVRRTSIEPLPVVHANVSSRFPSLWRARSIVRVSVPRLAIQDGSAARWEAESAASAAGIQEQCIVMGVVLWQHLFGPLVNLYERLHKAIADSNIVWLFSKRSR